MTDTQPLLLLMHPDHEGTPRFKSHLVVCTRLRCLLLSFLTRVVHFLNFLFDFFFTFFFSILFGWRNTLETSCPSVDVFHVSHSVLCLLQRFCDASPIKEGLRRYGDGCDGRQVQVSLRHNKLRIFHLLMFSLLTEL